MYFFPFFARSSLRKKNDPWTGNRTFLDFSTRRNSRWKSAGNGPSGPASIRKRCRAFSRTLFHPQSSKFHWEKRKFSLDSRPHTEGPFGKSQENDDNNNGRAAASSHFFVNGLASVRGGVTSRLGWRWLASRGWLRWPMFTSKKTVVTDAHGKVYWAVILNCKKLSISQSCVI